MNWNTVKYLYSKTYDFINKVKPLISENYPFIVPVEFYVYKTNWKVIPYDDKKLIEVSKDGFTVLKDGTYNIFIRNYDDKYKKRMRFTMAHEIGHIVLDHHQILGGNLLTLDPRVKDYVEFQANVFAENVLMPVDLVLNIKDKSIENLSKKFNVSQKMAEVRMSHFDRDFKFLYEMKYI